MVVETLLCLLNTSVLLRCGGTRPWWRRIWGGGFDFLGSFCLTSHRIVLVKSSWLERLLDRPFQPRTIQELNEALATRGGCSLLHSEIGGAGVTFQGIGTHRFGTTEISDLTLESVRPAPSLCIRFLGRDMASEVLRRFPPQDAGLPHPSSAWTASDLDFLGIPHDLSIPANREPPGSPNSVRARLVAAMNAVMAHPLRVNSDLADQLIADKQLQHDRHCIHFVAAAYCLRGLTQERMGRREEAIADYLEALDVLPDFPFAVRQLYRYSANSGEQGKCGMCRHSNHNTQDVAEGLWACPWLGGTGERAHCQIQYENTETFVFELFNGENCTWGSSDSFYRAVPLGYEGRPVTLAAQREPT